MSANMTCVSLRNDFEGSIEKVCTNLRILLLRVNLAFIHRKRGIDKRGCKLMNANCFSRKPNPNPFINHHFQLSPTNKKTRPKQPQGGKSTLAIWKLIAM